MREPDPMGVVGNRIFIVRIALLTGIFVVLNTVAENMYYIVSGNMYPTVHAVMEFAGIIVAMSVSVMSWYEHRYRGDLKTLLLSAVFCIAGFLDMAHTLSYLGMPDFISANSVNKASYYWIMARLTQSFGILAAVLAGNRPYQGKRASFLLYAFLSISLAAVYFTAVYVDRLPPMYDTLNKAQTTLKIGLEYVVIIALAAAAAAILRRRQKNKSDFLLASALIAGIMSELAFTFYSNAYDVFNLLGHVYKIISFSFILKALLDEGLAVVYQSNLELMSYSEELAQVNRQLSIADGLKNDFLSNTNHELKTPLSAIVAFTELILDEENTGRLNEIQRDYLKEINDSSRELMGKINGLLELSGILGGKTVLHKENILLSEVVSAAFSAHEAAFREKGVQLSVKYEGQAEIYADRDKIIHILANLLDNALKFTDPGGAVLVAAGVDEQSQKAIISVIDTGIGIEPDHRESVFNMFYQADATTTRKYGGTGIGLTLAAKLAEMNGGAIEMKSEYGKGSEFKVMLPIYKEAL